MRDSERGKVSCEDSHRQGRPVSLRSEHAVLFVKKLIEENPHTAIREICDVSIGTAQRIVRDDLNLRKNRDKMDTLSPNRPAKETES